MKTVMMKIVVSFLSTILGGCSALPHGATYFPKPSTNLEYAVEKNSRALWDQVVENGEQINGHRNSVFVYAYQKQKYDIAYYVIDHGMDIEYDTFFDYFERIPYDSDWATYMDKFIETGYDINHREDGASIMHCFSKSEFLRANGSFSLKKKMEYLLAHDYQFSKQDLLDLLECRGRNYNAIRIVLEELKRKNIDTSDTMVGNIVFGNTENWIEKTYDGLTDEEKKEVYHYLAAFGTVQNFEVLEKRDTRALSEQKDAQGNSLLMIAAMTGNEETFDYLLKKGNMGFLNTSEDTSPEGTLLQKSIEGENETIIQKARVLCDDDKSYLIENYGYEHYMMKRYLRFESRVMIDWLQEVVCDFDKFQKKAIFEANLSDGSETFLEEILTIDEMRDFLSDDEMFGKVFCYVKIANQAELLLNIHPSPSRESMSYALMDILAGSGILGEYIGILEVCQKYGVELDARPLLEVAEIGNEAAFKKLLEMGVDIELSDDRPQEGLRALMCAAASSKSMLELALDCGADIEAKDGDGWTALFYAVISRRIENVKILLERGADKTVKDKDGKTPYDVAKENHVKEAQKLLK